MLKNNVQLIGNLGEAITVKNLESGKKVANFSLAVNENYKDKKGEKIIKTNWFNLVAWGNTAEILEKYTTKGSKIAINGSLSVNSYQDTDGNKRVKTEIICNEVLLLDSKKE